MKLTLAFGVYNKERHIESVVDSWISNLSGRNECEVVVVFDDCKDGSVDILHKYLREKKQDYMFLFADDRYEIFCNNLALKHASGDYIVFVQDDNWIYDKDWDLTLGRAIEKGGKVGAVGLLAGFRMLPDESGLKYQRIEIDRPHKKECFTCHNLPDYDLGLWRVDTICRPFCISRDLLLYYGGMDDAFSPACGDDLDLGMRLLRDGHSNLYVPFDIVNAVGSEQSTTKEFRDSLYAQAYSLNFQRHGGFLVERSGENSELLSPMEQTHTGQLIFKEDSAPCRVAGADSIAAGSGGNAARLLSDPLETKDGAAAEMLFRKGIGSLNAGDALQAVKYLEQAAMNRSELPNVQYALATAYAQLGDIFPAQRACKMELALQPDNRGAAELLEKIERAVEEYQHSLMS